jgi:hypothetical protein
MTKLTPAPSSANGSAAKVPSGSVLAIQWDVGLLVEPGVEFSTPSGRRDDLNLG